jgi:hypothetical protein
MADVDQDTSIGDAIANPGKNTKSHVETLGLDDRSLRSGSAIRAGLPYWQVVLGNGNSKTLSCDSTLWIHFESSVVCLGRTNEISCSISLRCFRLSCDVIVIGSESAEGMYVVLVSSTCLRSEVRCLFPLFLADQMMGDLSA